MSTPVGHSRLHPLQPTHRAPWSPAWHRTCSASAPSCPGQRQAQRIRAAPRQVLFVTASTRNDGHITPASDFRQAFRCCCTSRPHPTRPPHSDQSSAVSSVHRFVSRVEPEREQGSSHLRGDRTIFPGLHDAVSDRTMSFTSAECSIPSRSPNTSGLMEFRADHPVPVLARMRALVFTHHLERGFLGDGAHAVRRQRQSSFRFTTGRTCRQPTDAWAYHVPSVIVLVKTPGSA